MTNQINKNSKTTNVSKEKREELLERITEIKTFIEKSADDENRKNLLKYIADLEKDVGAKKYGLVFEEHREEIDSKLEENTPVLTEEKKLFIDKGGEINFLIEGDNLASLQLLEKTHRGKIDLIYIDPPYNTGNNDFRYGDSFVDQTDTFRHSKWLSFMAKRLPIAKRLLSEKGVIFISIDDNEQAQLKLLCDEVFGENNFVANQIVISAPAGTQSSKDFAIQHQYCLAYKKSDAFVSALLPLTKDDIKERFNKQDEKGIYYTERIWKRGIGGRKEDVPSLHFPVYYNPTTNSIYIDDEINDQNKEECIEIIPYQTKGVLGRWTWSREKMKSEREDLIVLLVAGEYKLHKKVYYTDEIGKKHYSVIKADIGRTELGSLELKEILNAKLFDYPKYSELIKFFLTVHENNSATVLDFFAGSGTTGHAVLKLNAEDGGNRRFILCTNNENNICRDVTYERIKRVIEKEDYKASLKYFRVDFVPITERLFFEYADELLQHVKELVELENGINFTGNSRLAIVLTEKDLSDFMSSINKNTECEAVYLAHDILLNAEQKQIFKDKGVKINIIPDYYYRELAE